VSEQRCLTCSDEAVPGVVVEVEPPNATVEVEGQRERVGIELVEDVERGDTLLCHAGIALEKL
jgi:hydrogenase assembly chaperone HypC/HupF